MAFSTIPNPLCGLNKYSRVCKKSINSWFKFKDSASVCVGKYDLSASPYTDFDEFYGSYSFNELQDSFSKSVSKPCIKGSHSDSDML